MGDLLVEIVAEVRGGFSGIVVERGAAAFAVGDEVFGTIGNVVACKPAGLTHREAAVLAAFGPAALTAIQLSGARPGDRVMITGAGDDLGAIAVQIAKVRGSYVTAICDDRDVPFVWDVGADEVFARDRPTGSAHFVAVIDTDRSVTLENAGRLLEPDGRLIGIHDGAVEVSTASGAFVAQRRADEIVPDELVALVEHDRIYPVCR